MDYLNKFTEGQRVQCIDADGALSINIGDAGTVVELGRIKLDHNGYVGGWYHRRFKEVTTMKFKAGQRVRVTKESTWAQGLAGIITGNKTSSTGNFMGYLVTFDDDTKNIHGDRVFWEDHELTLEPPKPMSVTEALHAVIDGKTVIRVDNGGTVKIFMENNEIRLGVGEYKDCLKGYLSNYPDSQWKIYVEPPTPKFTPRQLVQNDYGTLGIVMEYKGDLRYTVRFSGLEGGTVKIMEEAELFKVDL